MRILTKEEVTSLSKPEGTNVRYYLFDEYELHYNEQVPGSTQTWHHHERVWETLYMVEGELTTEWREGNKECSKIIREGDIVEVERTPHTFTNHTEAQVRFIVLKQVLSGENKRDIFKHDKVLD